MRKPIIQAISNNMGTILVIRSPRSRKWLFNLSISTSVENTLITLKGRTMKTLIISALLFASFILSACDTPAGNVSPDKLTGVNHIEQWEGLSDSAKISMVSTRFIKEDSVSASCWYHTATIGKDSLDILGRRYTVSTRSRYRSIEEPVWFGDTIAEGAVILNEVRFFLDTKNDSAYAINICVEDVK